MGIRILYMYVRRSTNERLFVEFQIAGMNAECRALGATLRARIPCQSAVSPSHGPEGAIVRDRQGTPGEPVRVPYGRLWTIPARASLAAECRPSFRSTDVCVDCTNSEPDETNRIRRETTAFATMRPDAR